jgi:hypothetical protein
MNIFVKYFGGKWLEHCREILFLHCFFFSLNVSQFSPTHADPGDTFVARTVGSSFTFFLSHDLLVASAGDSCILHGVFRWEILRIFLQDSWNLTGRCSLFFCLTWRMIFFPCSTHAKNEEGDWYPGVTFVASILIARMHKVRCYPCGTFVARAVRLFFLRNSRQGSTSLSAWSGGS